MLDQAHCQRDKCTDVVLETTFDSSHETDAILI